MTMKSKSGAEMTPEYLDNVADWFEHEAKPEDFRPRKAGRPPLGADYPAPRIQVRVPSPLYRAVNKRAHDEGTTVSALVRRLLEGYAGAPKQ